MEYRLKNLYLEFRRPVGTLHLLDLDLKGHPVKDIDMICENCKVLLCSKCAIQKHREHTFEDPETIYLKNLSLFLDKIYSIHQCFSQPYKK